MDPQSELARIIEEARPCFQCGICSSSCPVYRVTPELNPRLAIDNLIQKSTIEPSGREWACALCLMCEQRCPTGVSLAHILITIKNISAQRGSAPSSVIEAIHSLMSLGVIAQSTGLERKRSKYNLPKLQLPDHDQIQKLLELTGAIAILESHLKMEEIE